jgi:hypothetical protein
VAPRGSDIAAHRDTRALMRAAVDDGVRSTARADVRRAAPLRAPRDLRALAAFVVVAGAVVALAFGPETRATNGAMVRGWPAAAATDDGHRADRTNAGDLALVRIEIADLREQVRRDRPDLREKLDRLDALLAAAQAGEIGKAQLLEQVDAILDDGHGVGSPQLADIRDLIHRASPSPPPPPDPPPPTDPGVCQGNGPPEPGDHPKPGLGDSIGNENGPPVLGPETLKRAQFHNEELHGDPGEGVSRRQTIKDAARHGFATRPYARVYAEYRSVLEEVLSSEHVPQGYRTAVKLYFARIHPQD